MNVYAAGRTARPLAETRHAAPAPSPAGPDLPTPAPRVPPRPAVRESAPARAGVATVAVLALAVVAGLVAGALTSFGQTLLGGTPFQGLANAVSPWLVAPFLVGALARRGSVAAVAGLLVCAGEVAGYYLTADLRGFAVGASSVAVWVVSGVVGGPVFGWAGRQWRVAADRWRGLGPALLVGCWLAEAVVTYAVVLRYVPEALVFATAAGLLVPVLGRLRRQTRDLVRWLPAAALAGAAGFAGVHVVLAAVLA